VGDHDIILIASTGCARIGGSISGAVKPVDAVALRGRVDPVEVPHALRLDQRCHRTPEDAEPRTLHLRPSGVEGSVADRLPSAVGCVTRLGLGSREILAKTFPPQDHASEGEVPAAAIARQAPELVSPAPGAS
jgi:hypothetical protein